MTTKSPFYAFSRKDLARYRKLAETVRDWKRDAAPGRFEILRPSHQILGKLGGGTWEALVLGRFAQRALNQLARRDSWPAIAEQHRLTYLQAYDPAAYETHQLRTELAAIRARLVEVERLASHRA